MWQKVEEHKQAIDGGAGNASGNHENAKKAYDDAMTILNQAV
jgi:hypothetical protein